MHIGNRYKIKEFLFWTRRDVYLISIISIIPTVLYKLINLKFLAIPWVPVALIGTAAAFIVGFKNTQTYNRLWEARQIWGSIINTSRSFGMLTRDFIDVDKNIHKEIIYRHFAWLTALRFQLREQKAWENTKKARNQEFLKFYSVHEWENKVDDELKKYLSEEDFNYIITKKNKATQLISLQSKYLKELKKQGKVEALNYIELENLLINLYEQQGKCERIKNFPYPRQFASINLYFVWLMVCLLPFGLLNEFNKLGDNFVWLTIPFSIIVSWVFVAMDSVGEASENPFEGGSNDIPMYSLSINIEIDLRDMLDEKDLPLPINAINNIMM